MLSVVTVGSVARRSGQRYVVLTKSFPCIYTLRLCTREKRQSLDCHTAWLHTPPRVAAHLSKNCWWKRASGNLQRTLVHACVFTGSLVRRDDCRKSRKWHLVADTVLTPPALFLGRPIPPINFSEPLLTPRRVCSAEEKRRKKFTAASHL